MRALAGPNPVPIRLSQGHIGTPSKWIESKVSTSALKFARGPLFDPVFSRVLQYYQDPNFGLLLSGYGSSMGLFSGVA